MVLKTWACPKIYHKYLERFEMWCWRRMQNIRWSEVLRKQLVFISVFVGPCHHVMARPQVADGGTASDMEGSRE